MPSVAPRFTTSSEPRPTAFIDFTTARPSSSIWAGSCTLPIIPIHLTIHPFYPTPHTPPFRPHMILASPPSTSRTRIPILLEHIHTPSKAMFKFTLLYPSHLRPHLTNPCQRWSIHPHHCPSTMGRCTSRSVHPRPRSSSMTGTWERRTS